MLLCCVSKTLCIKQLIFAVIGVVTMFVLSKIDYRFLKKYYWIAYIPFCVPYILLYNQNPERVLISAYMLIFVFSFILFNQNIKRNETAIVILFALISAVASYMRSEYMCLFIFLPLIILIMKVFTYKKFIVFILFFYLFAFCYGYFDKILGSDNYYKLHNLSFLNYK